MSAFSRPMLFQHFLAAALFVALGALLAWSRVPPVSVEYAFMDTDHAPPGGSISIRRGVDWVRPDCREASLSADMIDSLGQKHAFEARPLTYATLPSNTTATWTVPFAMPWGKATYRASIVASCFPFYSWWPVTEGLGDLTFMVEKPPAH